MKKWIILALTAGLMVLGCTGSGDDSIRAAGVVDGDVVSVKSEARGPLIDLSVREGDRVTAGHRVARMDARKVENQLEAVEIADREVAIQQRRLREGRTQLTALRDYAVRNHQRFLRLLEKKAVSGDQLETARLKRIEAESAMRDNARQLEALENRKAANANRREALRLLLSDHRFDAPVNGIVLEIHVIKGETLFPGSTLLEILDTSSLFVEVFVEEEELSRIVLNQKARILVDGHKDAVKGKVVFFGRRAEFSPKYILSEKERRNLLVQVKVRIPLEAADIVKLGMPVTVEFVR